ncbi:MAG: DUF2190 family protein [Planctomycetaceae bacterium]|nr:DUF2190 family protein [Planctomycetaceae bacterium]
MNARFVQDGNAIDYTPSAAVAAGQVVTAGKIIGIAKRDIRANELGALHLVGVYDIVKAAGAVTLGAEVYWDATATNATTTASTNALIGIAVAAAASGDETVRVRIGK